MVAPLADGPTTARGLLDSADVRATERAMRQLGASISEPVEGGVVIAGPVRWQPPGTIDCGNSGTTARLLMGLLAGLGLPAVLVGDASLCERPMDRVAYPLQAMGAKLRYLGEKGALPIELAARSSGSLRPINHRPRMASAQVKSCLLLAGLAANVRVEVREPAATRDHTERLLRRLGAPLSAVAGPNGAPTVRLEPRNGQPLRLRPIAVPGDFSSAAFLLAASWLGAGPLKVRGVGLNPTRTGLLSVAERMNASWEAVGGSKTAAGEVSDEEPVGDLRVRPATLRAFEIDERELPGVVDEVPVLAVLAARARGTSRIRGAAELRSKESDRLAALAENLSRIGVSCREHPDGLDIEGTERPLAGLVRPRGDHRVAMAFGALGAAPGCDIAVEQPECVDVSYPGFWRDLDRLSRSEAT